MRQLTNPEIQWDFGTAYELFISLHVLHNSDHYGVRPSYAAGVRSRIPAIERKFLEDVYPFLFIPLKWIHSLPTPKDAISALWSLKQIPPAERMAKLYGPHDLHESENVEDAEKHKKYNQILSRIMAEGKWNPEDAEALLKIFIQKGESVKKETLERYLNWWSRPAEFGEAFLSTLQAYYQAFFEEEEKRVEPILKTGLRRAQEMAATRKFEDLFSELSQGIQWGGGEFQAKKVIIAPAFWTTPLIFFDKIDKDTLILVFGARPADMSVIPGETLPDGLVRSLKALADPTRLKILFYLSQESLSPSELARRLQLRAPTVTHHLSELRLASLVNVNTEGQEKKYRARREALQATFTNLQDFLKITEQELPEKSPA
jgi:DNA-binding transcriptional ArsR family regulator